MSKSSVFIRAIAIVILVASGMVSASAQAPKPTQAPKPQPPPATASTPVPAGYVIGPEDVLAVFFWREPDMSGDVAVRPDGRITLPLIGEMVATGQTPELLRDQIQKAAAKYLTEANVTVVVKTINSRKVYILGQVAKPEAYPLIGPRTVMQLIAQAGGLMEYAKAEEITVMRQEKTGQRVFKFNYKDVSKGKKPDLDLQPGDRVVVP
jgi:polysaccharide biosynthesis/export protein